MLNFVLCDDNPIILDKLSKMLNSIFITKNYDAIISFKSTQANEILEYVAKNPVDVLILDIKLNSGLSGIDLAEKIREKNKNVYIIFTTGHLEYALIAYQVKTFDYIPKPLTVERLTETVVRLFDDMNNQKCNFIKIANSKIVVKEDDINFIKRDGMKLVYNTTTKDFETYSSFNKIQDSLPKSFIRCHKSYIANINNINNIEPQKNIILFNNNSYCSIGPKYKNNLMEVISNYGINN